MVDSRKRRSLTLYRLDEAVDVPDQYIRPDKVVERYWISPAPGKDFLLLVQKSPGRSPRWAEFFQGFVPLDVFGTAKTTSAALLVPLSGTWYAVTFGQGRYLLNQQYLVEGFGLRVALNTIGEEGLRSLDKETFDSLASQARQQASRDVSAGEFQLEADRDLLRSITGTPDDAGIAKRLTGKDALGISAHIDLPSLADRLELIDRAYEKNTYSTRFPWVDQIKPLADSAEIEDLEEQLIEIVRGGDLSRTWLAPRDILDWSQVRFFSYQFPPRAERTDIHWKTFLQTVRGELSVPLLKRRRVFCVGDDDQCLADWPVYGCIYGELEKGGESYLLSAGRWYKIDRSLVAQVDVYLESIPQLHNLLPKYDDESEGDYNRRVAAVSEGRYCLLDRDFVLIEGAVGKVEVCDLLGVDGDLIHVKRYSGSRGLSHLFMQGLVSGDSLHLESDFRSAVAGKVPAEFGDMFEHFESSEHRIVFGIISASRKPLRLPFFSKVALRHTCKRLLGNGYRVALSKIEMEEGRAKLQRIRQRRRRSGN